MFQFCKQMEQFSKNQAKNTGNKEYLKISKDFRKFALAFRKQQKIKPTITERQLKRAIRWYLTMNTWETTPKQLEKTEKMKQMISNYAYGNSKLKSKKAI